MLIDKNSMPLVAIEFMNDTHRDEIDIIYLLYSLVLKYETQANKENEESINAAYQEWMLHTLEHFGTEETKMLALGFPPYQMHKGEHEKELTQMDRVFRQWQSSKDIKMLKNYIGIELPQWLSNHIQTMDAVTAMFFQSKEKTARGSLEV